MRSSQKMQEMLLTKSYYKNSQLARKRRELLDLIMDIYGNLYKSQNNLEKEQRGFTLPDIKTNKTTINKTVWYFHKDGRIDPKNPESRNKPSHISSTDF